MCQGGMFKVNYNHSEGITVYAVDRNPVTYATEFLIYYPYSGEWKWVPANRCELCDGAMKVSFERR